MKIKEQIRNCLFLAIIAFSNAGCLSTSVSFLELHIKDNPASGIILDVPFVEQKKEFCGPAALSSVFAFWKRPVTQDKIAEVIFQPELCGVLNIDLEKYARDFGFWAKGYETDFEDLKNQLLDGVPVIVIQKLHPFILNRNHYTVVTGFSDKHKAIIEHTGSRASVVRSYRGFKRNWYAGGGWMLKVVPFDKAGDIQNKEDNIELGTVLESHGFFEEALKRYNAALKLDKESYIALFNIGNIYMQRQDWVKAEAAYKQAITLNDTFADAYNNLAYIYLKTEKYSLAHEHIDKALSLDSIKGFYYMDTKAQVLLAQKRLPEAIRFIKEALLNGQNIPKLVLIDFNEFWLKQIPQTKDFLSVK
ncbi:MAG: PA2778 family cysteine peptidase [Candidatus Omnitrophica bacterium]|nr:PA2778 family cysteine peptidase [Candidatus Omnitrophota bacterium]